MGRTNSNRLSEWGGQQELGQGLVKHLPLSFSVLTKPLLKAFSLFTYKAVQLPLAQQFWNIPRKGDSTPSLGIFQCSVTVHVRISPPCSGETFYT